jgi:hypothetical protein
MQAGETYEGEMPSEVRTLLEERAGCGWRQEENLVKALQRTGVFASALAALAKGSDDVEYEENAVRALARRCGWRPDGGGEGPAEGYLGEVGRRGPRGARTRRGGWRGD